MELDRDVYVWVVEHRVPPLDWLFVALSVAGYAGLLWIGLAAVLALWAQRPVLPTMVLVAATVWATDLVTLGVKSLVGRERPFEAPPEYFGGVLGPNVVHVTPEQARVLLTVKESPEQRRNTYTTVHWPESAQSAAARPARLPKVIVSMSALPPSRLAPWTETQAHSPAA